MNKQEHSQCYRGMYEHSYCSILQQYFAAQLSCVNAISQYAALILGLIFTERKFLVAQLHRQSCHVERKKSREQINSYILVIYLCLGVCRTTADIMMKVQYDDINV